MREILRREFGGMRERAKRTDALADAKWLLAEWRDYGDSAKLDEALAILRSAR
jgi:hypothetical protein